MGGSCRPWPWLSWLLPRPRYGVRMTMNEVLDSLQSAWLHTTKQSSSPRQGMFVRVASAQASMHQCIITRCSWGTPQPEGRVQHSGSTMHAHASFVKY